MCNHDKLREALLKQLQAQKRQTGQEASGQDAAKRLGTLLSIVCQEKGWSVDDLAHRLNIEPELAQALLVGLLPRSEIDMYFLKELSQIMGITPKALHSLLNEDAAL